MIRKFPKFVLALLSIFCAANITTQLTYADALGSNDYVVRITPTVQRLELDPGNTYEGVITVVNSGDKEFDFGTFIRPYSVTGDNYDPDYDSVTAHTQITDWITLNSSTGHLAPGASAEVKYTIKVPQDVPAGGQYCTIFAGTGDSANDGDMFKPIGSVGTVILAQVNGETRRAGTYRDQQLSQFVMFGPFSARASFENTGNVDYTVTSTLTARNFFTGNYDFDNSEAPSQLTVFPDKPRTIALAWPDQPLLGIYNVTYNIKFLDQDHTLTRVVIFCPIWVILLFVGLIVFLVIYAVLDRKRRKRF